MGTTEIAAILPLSDRLPERRNLGRAALLLNSLNAFWTDAAKLRVHIVMPDNEFDSIKLALSPFIDCHNISLVFLRESSVSPVIANAPANLGIAKHMLIKLASNSYTNAKFNLVLDSDLFLRTATSARDLVVDGRASVYYWSPHLPWYECSARVLKCERLENLAKPRMFVTPQILSSDILEGLQHHLSELYGAEDWISTLLSLFVPTDNQYWTEYTLYDLFAEQSGMWRTYHIEDGVPQIPLHCMDASIWTPGHAQAWDVNKMFDENSVGRFAVLQSIMAAVIDFDLIQSETFRAWRAKYPEHVSRWVDTAG